MQVENSAERRATQASIWDLLPECLDNLAPIADDRVQLVALSDDFHWRLRYLRRGGTIRAHHVFPCSECGAPIALVRLIHTNHVLRLDAKRITVPGWPQYWEANLFASHQCRELAR